MPKKAKDNSPSAGNRESLVGELESLAKLIAEKGAKGVRPDKANIPRETLVLARLIRNITPEDWKDISTDPRFKHWVAIPLNEDIFPFLAHQEDRFDTFTYSGDSDPLTGLYNRRRFLQMLDMEFQRAKWEGGDLCLALFRLLEFEELCTTSGHACGDHVLSAFGKLLSKVKRDSDLASRLGGEQFALLLPGLGPNKAQALLDKFVRTFGALNFTCKGSESFSVSVNTGMVHSKGNVNLRSKDLLSLAEKAISQAGQMGRNRIVVTHTRERRVFPKTTMVQSDEKRFLFTGGR